MTIASATNNTAGAGTTPNSFVGDESEVAARLVGGNDRAALVDDQRQTLEHRKRAERHDDRRQAQGHGENAVHQPEGGAEKHAGQRPPTTG